METFKIVVRYMVLVFVMTGSLITLAGLDTATVESESASKDKQNQNKEYATSEQDILNIEVGSTG